jgi:hypothetical protein
MHVSQLQFFFCFSFRVFHFLTFVCQGYSMLVLSNDLGTNVAHVCYRNWVWSSLSVMKSMLCPPSSLHLNYSQPIPNFDRSIRCIHLNNQQSPGMVPPRAESNDNLPGHEVCYIHWVWGTWTAVEDSIIVCWLAEDTNLFMGSIWLV